MFALVHLDMEKVIQFGYLFEKVLELRNKLRNLFIISAKQIGLAFNSLLSCYYFPSLEVGSKWGLAGQYPCKCFRNLYGEMRD